MAEFHHLAEKSYIWNKEVESVESVHMKIYQWNTCGKDVSWLHFDDDSRVQEKQHEEKQQS